MASRFEVETMARQLMKKHGLHDWKFKWDNAKSRLGLCSYKNKTISLSWPFADINDIDVAHDTMLHEIAHALLDPKHGHDGVWMAKCIEIGARPDRCISVPHYEPKGRFEYQCTSCGHNMYFHKKVKNKYFCSKCDKLTVDFKKESQIGGGKVWIDC